MLAKVHSLAAASIKNSVYHDNQEDLSVPPAGVRESAQGTERERSDKTGLLRNRNDSLSTLIGDSLERGGASHQTTLTVNTPHTIFGKFGMREPS